MKLEIEALAPFTAYTGEMVVLAPGDTAFLPEKMAQDYIDAGLATLVAKSKKSAASAKGKKSAEPVEQDEAEPIVNDESADNADQGEAAPAAADAPPAA